MWLMGCFEVTFLVGGGDRVVGTEHWKTWKQVGVTHVWKGINLWELFYSCVAV